MTISLRMHQTDAILVKQLAGVYGKSVSEFIRDIVLEKIEDDLDKKAYLKAKEEFLADPKTVSFAQLSAELGM